MSNTIVMDTSGRLVIPSEVRERFGLKGKVAEFEIESSPEGIMLRPKGGYVPMARTQSGWILFDSRAAYDSSGPAAADTVDPVEAIEKDRADRIASIESRD